MLREDGRRPRQQRLERLGRRCCTTGVLSARLPLLPNQVRSKAGCACHDYLVETSLLFGLFCAVRPTAFDGRWKSYFDAVERRGTVMPKTAKLRRMIAPTRSFPLAAGEEGEPAIIIYSFNPRGGSVPSRFPMATLHHWRARCLTEGPWKGYDSNA